MNLKQFNNLKKGDIVFNVVNTGSAGIFPYQYLGVFHCHGDKVDKHLFISSYFLSCLSITYGSEDNSRFRKQIFLTEKEAIQYKRQLIKEGE